MIKKIVILLSLITGVGAYLLSALPAGDPSFFLKYLWVLVVGLISGLIGYTILFFVIIFILSLFIDTKKEYEHDLPAARWIFNATVEFIFDLARVKVVPNGLEKVPTDKKFMLVTNHKSNFDPMVEVFYLRKSHPVHISKPENFKIPIAGPFMKRCGFLAIDRDNNRNGALTIIKAIKYIKDNEYSVGVAPEGTRNKEYSDRLLPFKDGCFKIALKANSPIVICTVKNTEKIHKNFPFKKTVVYLDIVRVLEYEEFKDLNTHEIADIVRKEMNQNLGYKEIVEEE